MNEDFVTFEIAKKLEEKGFKEKCIAHYYCTIKLFEYNMKDISFRKKLLSTDFMHSYNDSKKGDKYIDAPTISQVLKWLRKEHKVYIEPCILADCDTDADNKVINTYTYWSFSIANIETGDMIYFEYEHIDDKRFDSYEEAAIAGIEYCLDNLI